MPQEPRTAHSVVEASLYLTVTPCAACRHGALVVSAPVAGDAPEVVGFTTTCRNCGVAETFWFRLPEAVGPADLRADPVSSNAPISTVAEPSRLIDPVQWVTLAQLELESVAATPSAGEQRWARIRAAQCLDEALKFYTPDNELPPEDALLAESSRAALREFPQRFARPRLAAQRAALPADGLVNRVVNDPPGAPRRKPWWRIW